MRNQRDYHSVMPSIDIHVLDRHWGSKKFSMEVARTVRRPEREKLEHERRIIATTQPAIGTRYTIRSLATLRYSLAIETTLRRQAGAGNAMEEDLEKWLHLSRHVTLTLAGAPTPKAFQRSSSFTIPIAGSGLRFKCGSGDRIRRVCQLFRCAFDGITARRRLIKV